MSEKEKYFKELEELREKINQVDDKIIDFLNQRGEIVLKIGKYKKILNLEVYQPQREIEIIERIKKKSSLLKPSSIEAIWKEIMGSSKAIQGRIVKVGYLGPKGTFTHQAALEFFSKTDTEFIGNVNIFDIFEDIEKDTLNFGVIPIENSLQGTVRNTLDLLIEKNLVIYSEIELRIIQNLIIIEDSKLSNIEKVFSHPQAFAQSKTWLKKNIPAAELINTNSTSEAIKKVKDLNDKRNAAIGPEFACNMFNLRILNSKIEDNPSNFTRFLIISKMENKIKEGKIKTSLVYVTKHVPGALYQVLKIFADATINLLKIESRPRRIGRWEYIFLMDFEGDKEDPKIKIVLEKMESSVIWFKILGSYPYN